MPDRLWTRASSDVMATGAMVRSFGALSWLSAIVGMLVALIVIGTPTRLIANAWFIRMTPARPQDYAFWIASAVLIGLIAGSYAAGRANVHEYKVLSGGMFSYLAVGCPICNKLVVLLLGVSGAMTYFAPAQLFIGFGSVALLAWTLTLRARSLVFSCDIPQARKASVQAARPVDAMAITLLDPTRRSDATENRAYLGDHRGRHDQ